MKRLILLTVLLAILAVPATASAYLHVENCQAGLRYGGGGDWGGDDDIHVYGVTYGYSAWGGWHSSSRNSSTSVNVYFSVLQDGVWYVRGGHCAGNDGGFNDGIPWVS